jgi:N-acetylneuraminate synthase
VGTARDAGASEIALLVCSSAYPSPPEAIRLRRLADLRQRLDVVVGLSDHTLGTEVAVSAVALGASLVEKHLCLSRSDPGPDSAFSLEPEELAGLVARIRVAERALGESTYGPSDAERPSLGFRRSLFVVAPVKKGDTFTEHNVRSVRPADGLHPRHLAEVVGRRAAADIAAATPLACSLVEGGRGE